MSLPKYGYIGEPSSAQLRSRRYPNRGDPSAWAGITDHPYPFGKFGDSLLDMSAAVVSHRRLVKLGVDASLYVMEGGWHAASYGTRGSPEEIDVNTYVGRWFEQHLAPGGTPAER